MRRSTAAAIGTLTGAALIVGVRLSVTPVAPVAAPPVVDLAGGTPSSSAAPARNSSAPAKNSPAPAKKKPAATKSGLKDGIYQGKGATNPYGTVQVSIKIEDGEITKADATYPVAGESGKINPAAVPKLNEEAVQAKSGKDVDAVSGATFTSASYQESLQAALDSAKA